MRFNNDIAHRVMFYYHYFRDVVPFGVTVHHVRNTVYAHNIREEIELRTPEGNVFMYGLVGMRFTRSLVEAAGDEAYTKFSDGYFVDDNERYRFFTATRQLDFYKGYGDEGYEPVESFDLIEDAGDVAEYLQRQYERLRHH